VPDTFDEFMEELRRRQAEATGRRRPPAGGDGEEDPISDDDPESVFVDATDGPPDDEANDDPDLVDSDEPEPIRPAAGRGPGRGARPPLGPRRRGTLGGPGDGRRSIRRQIAIGVAIILGIFIVLMAVVGLELWTDAIWYTSVGFGDVFFNRLRIQGLLFAGGAAATLAILLFNLWLAGRLLPPAGDGSIGGSLRSLVDRLNEAAESAQRGTQGRPTGPFDPRRPGQRPPIEVSPIDLPDPTPIGRVVIGIVCVFIAVTVGGALASNWETIALWANRVPYAANGGAAVTDPIFGRDISFFLFELPFLRFLQVTLIGLVIASLVVAAARYLVGALANRAVFSTAVRVHLGVLAGLFLLVIAIGYQLDKFELVYSDRGIASGVSYTDYHAQLLAFDVLTGLSAIAAAFLVGGALSRVAWPLALTAAVWFLASIGIGRLYPAAIQQFTVKPNEFAQEQPFIANNIAMTRLAFDLNGWDVHDYNGDAPLTEAAIQEHQATFLNARLWDYRPLGDTIDQLQTVRQYYAFTDVDTDRYKLGADTRQVMLSARELALEKNPLATGWVNERVIYTHGIGVAMAPVNDVASQGQPRLVIENLPPVSTQGAPPITEPRIYFGERPSSYVVVGARQHEFDYPRGQTAGGADVPVETSWTGKTGIKLDTTLARLLFALRFGDLNLLISDQVTSDSQLLFHRSLSDRLPRIAPFLRYDHDPYVVINGAGRLVYIQDAYTTSDRFPHAQPFDPTDLTPTLGPEPLNYIRNSVKIVEDAYDGTMSFYVNDPNDPLIRAWQGVFPTLFRPMSEFPADLRPHIRVPEDLFNVQTSVYGRYHVQNELTFYQQDDLWTVPSTTANKQVLPSEAYYVIMSLPEAVNPEFLLLQPMIPKARPNMIAWVAARNDGANYGQTRVYRFPTGTSVFGPEQIEARIDSQREISAQITLWNTSGSEVIRGNLIVVPVGDSIVYLQPVYLRSTSTKFPAFQKIIVASPTTVVWGDTLRQALDQLLTAQTGGAGPGSSPGPTPTPGPGGTPSPSGSPGPGPTPPSGDVAALVEYANQHFELAQQALRDGNFARYGEEIALVQQALSQLNALVGASTGPSPAPSANP
jgi:uncharacterized membrane protein (UPF0182 family)